MYTIHTSDVTAYEKCPRAFWLSSPLYQGLETVRPQAPFFTGRVVHTALEDFYMTDEDLYTTTYRAIEVEKARALVQGTSSAQLEALMETEEPLIFGMMEHYNTWIQSERFSKQPFSDNNLEFLDMETKFTVPLYNKHGKKSNKINYGGRFDGIVRHRGDGSIWLFETKTARSIPEFMKNLFLPPQARGYVMAARQQYGRAVSGILFNVLRKKVPTTPRVLASGKLSVAKNIDTSLEKLWHDIQMHHGTLDGLSKKNLVDMYRERLDGLAAENTFFERVALRFTDNNLEMMGRKFHSRGLEMVNPNTGFPGIQGWLTCNFCSFRGMCEMMEEGKEWDDVFEALGGAYRKRTDRILRPFFVLDYMFAPLSEDVLQIWLGDQLLVQETYEVAIELVRSHLKEDEIDGFEEGLTRSKLILGGHK